MKHKKKAYFIPVVTSKAGTCLTLKNWQEVGAEGLSYHLHELLMKPGMDLLHDLPDWRSFCGWQGTLVLNASWISRDNSGIYAIRSHFDGSVIRITEDELFSIVLKLNPDVVIFPSCFLAYLTRSSQSIPSGLNVYIAQDDISSTSGVTDFGCYLAYDQKKPFSDFLKCVKKYKAKSVYLAGEFDLLQLEELVAQGFCLIESDKPANDAINGKIYTLQGDIVILEPLMAEQHDVIDATCGCPTCEQGLTRAYLHHLLVQTPLLCQRFLIQHNEYNYLQAKRSIELSEK